MVLNPLSLNPCPSRFCASVRLPIKGLPLISLFKIILFNISKVEYNPHNNLEGVL